MASKKREPRAEPFTEDYSAGHFEFYLMRAVLDVSRSIKGVRTGTTVLLPKDPGELRVGLSLIDRAWLFRGTGSVVATT